MTDPEEPTPTQQDVIEQVKRLYATTNAQVWAQEFMAVLHDLVGDHVTSGHSDLMSVFDAVDEGWMIGWFANALETAKTHEQRAQMQKIQGLLLQGLEAWRLTREYLGSGVTAVDGNMVLPEIEGWSWFDWCEAVREYLNPTLPVVDWRAMFAKYMQVVGQNEGYDFLAPDNGIETSADGKAVVVPAWTEEEWTAIEALQAEVFDA